MDIYNEQRAVVGLAGFGLAEVLDSLAAFPEDHPDRLLLQSVESVRDSMTRNQRANEQGATS